MLVTLTSKRIRAGLALFVLISLLLAARHLQLFQRSWYQVIEWQSASEWRDQSIWLPSYMVSIQAMPIAGIANNLSGLTYDPSRQSLFAVTNEPSVVFELSLDGRVLRQIPLIGFRDAEAITYLSPGVFVIADERKQRLLKVSLSDNSTSINAVDAQHLSIGIGLNGNKGFEGLAYDPIQKRLFVAKERDPLQILEIQGFAQSDSTVPFALHVTQHNGQLFVRDLSSLFYDQATGHLLVVSDESHVVLELTADAKPISHLSLRGGQHGLKADVPQAEGSAMDANGNLYILSEPNLFYVFKKTPR